MASSERWDAIFDGGTALGLGTGELLDRFADRGDEAAFAALVARHGPMVLATCRRILPDTHDADDAFQATFLVLARCAGTISDPDRLAPWLHGVARRVAVRLRTLAARRRAVEGAGDVASLAAAPTTDRDDLRAILDEELARLPAKYRDPLVLCYLEGLTHDQAAGQLRWPVGTVRSRLAGGRDRLRVRLARRGYGPSAALPPSLPLAVVARPLAASTLRLVLSPSSRSPVALLAQGVIRSMFLTKLRIALGLAAATTLLVAGTAGLVVAQKSDQPTGPQAVAPVQTPPPDPPRPAPPAPDTYPLTVSGHARDAAGRPIAGARIFLASTRNDASRRLAEARTDGAGLYRFRDVPLPIGPPDEGYPNPGIGGFTVFGLAEGSGFAWLPAKRVVFAEVPALSAPADEFQPDDPIVLNLKFPPPARVAGRLVDDRGRPIARAQLRLWNWARPALDQPDQEIRFVGYQLLPAEVLDRATDEEGRFTFDGLPPGERFAIDVKPPGFAGRLVQAATTPKPPPAGRDGPIRVSPIDLVFETASDVPFHVAIDPTGRPAPRVLVRVYRQWGEDATAQGTTDDAGQLILRLPPGPYGLSVLPEYRAPYLATESESTFVVPATGPVRPVAATLRPACVLEVTVIEATSGKAVAGVNLWENRPATPGTSRRAADRGMVFSQSWEAATGIAHIDCPQTDAVGKLRALVEPGPTRVGTECSFLPLQWEADEPNGRAIDGQPGQTISLTFRVRADVGRYIPPVEAKEANRP